jgi:hypothetical protein
VGIGRSARGFRLTPVEVEISPAPSAVEREAITAAFERLAEGADSYRGAWWEAGVRENLDEEVDS